MTRSDQLKKKVLIDVTHQRQIEESKLFFIETEATAPVKFKS